jgi:hypothetical protein
MEFYQNPRRAGDKDGRPWCYGNSRAGFSFRPTDSSASRRTGELAAHDAGARRQGRVLLSRKQSRCAGGTPGMSMRAASRSDPGAAALDWQPKYSAFPRPLHHGLAAADIRAYALVVALPVRSTLKKQIGARHG